MTANSWLAGSVAMWCIVQPTILCLSETGLEIIQGQVRHSALEIVEIHSGEAVYETVR